MSRMRKTTFKMASPRVLLQIDTNEEDVYCLTNIHTHDFKYLLTGHGGGKVKLWDKNGTLANTIQLPFTDDVTCICTTPTTLAVSVNNHIILYDIKKLSEPLAICAYNKDEINQLKIKGDYLLACDDSGQVTVIDISNPRKPNHRSTCKYHDMCMTIAFHPHKRWEMVSGGMDSIIVLWDYSRGRPLDTLDVKESLNQSTPEGAYFVNPPMIHSICTLNNKPLLAAGLGNGSIVLLSLNSGGKIKLLSTLECHSTSIATITSFSNEDGSDAIISGGNDSKLICCHVIKNPLPTSSGNGSKGAAVKTTHTYSLSQEGSYDHRSKINWIENLNGWSQETHVVGVADQTSIVTLYSF